jgi:hypothetical protein
MIHISAAGRRQIAIAFLLLFSMRGAIDAMLQKFLKLIHKRASASRV